MATKGIGEVPAPGATGHKERSLGPPRDTTNEKWAGGGKEGGEGKPRKTVHFFKKKFVEKNIVLFYKTFQT